MYTVDKSLNGIKYLMYNGRPIGIIKEYHISYLKSLNTLAIRTVGFRLFGSGF